MKYNLEDEILFTESGETAKGEIIDIRGDYFVVSRGFRETLVDKDRVIGLASEHQKFSEGGQPVVVEENPNVGLVNSTEFYRYYPMQSEPFKISHDPANKYGFGMYFLDNPDFYKDKFENARLVKIKPKVKSPLILTYHKRTTPSFEYMELLKGLIEKGEVADKGELSNKLINSGFDCLVIYEPRGIYLILLKEDESLFEVISDLGSFEQMSEGGLVDSNGLDSDITVEISEIVAHDYKDISGYQGEILYRNFNDDMDSFFIPSKSDTEYISDLVAKGYLQRDYEIVGTAYSLTEKGKELVSDVINAVM